MSGRQAILWDNDGVLVDTEKWFFESNRRALAELGVEVSWEQFEEINLKHGQSLLPLSGLQGDPLAALYVHRDAIYSDLLRGEEIVIPGMAELLRGFKGRFQMGIVTASHREHFEIIHGRSGILEHVEFAVVREDYQLEKPHPDGYLTGIGKTGLGAGDCLAVEDSPRGIAAARAAGLDCIFFTPGGVGRGREVGEVWARASSVDELGVAIEAWAAGPGAAPA